MDNLYYKNLKRINDIKITVDELENERRRLEFENNNSKLKNIEGKYFLHNNSNNHNTRIIYAQSADEYDGGLVKLMACELIACKDEFSIRRAIRTDADYLTAYYHEITEDEAYELVYKANEFHDMLMMPFALEE